MNALIWKKYKNIIGNRKNTIYFLGIPIAIMLLLFFYGKNPEAIVFYFSVISILLGFFTDQMDLETLIYKEYALYTPMTLKKSWIMNSVINWFSKFLYSSVILILVYLIYWFTFGELYVPLFILLKGLLNGISCFGIILFCSQVEVDFAMWKQYLFFIWVPALLLLVFIMDAKSSIIPVGFSMCVWLALFSLAFATLALIINKNVNIEKYILSLEKVTKIASVRFNLMD